MDKSPEADRAYDLALAASYVLAVLDVDPGSEYAVKALKKAGPKATQALQDVIDDAGAKKLAAEAGRYVTLAIQALDKDPKGGALNAISYLDDVILLARRIAKKFGDDPSDWKNLTAEAREVLKQAHLRQEHEAMGRNKLREMVRNHGKPVMDERTEKLRHIVRERLVEADEPNEKLVIHMVAAAKDLGVSLDDDESVAAFFTQLKMLATTQKAALAKAFKKYKSKDVKTLSRTAAAMESRELREAVVPIAGLNLLPKSDAQIDAQIAMLTPALRGGAIVEFEGQEDLPNDTARALVGDLLAYFQTLRQAVDPEASKVEQKKAERVSAGLLKRLPSWLK